MTESVLHTQTLGTLLTEHARSYPDQLALVDGDVRLTWPELDARVHRVAAALTANGVARGDRILWLGQNSFRVLELLFACARVGAVICPANWRQSPDELAFVIDDVDARIVVWQEEEVGESVRAGRERAGSKDRALWLRHDVDASHPESYEGVLIASDAGAGGEPTDGSDVNDAVLMIYTAAFEGHPNGALLSQRALIAQSLLMLQLQKLDGSAVYLNCGPMFHVGMLFTTFPVLLAAGTNVIVPRVDAEELCRLIEVERCTGGYIMAPTVEQIVELNADRRYDLSSLRVSAMSGGAWAEMTTPDDSMWWSRPGGYGQTETFGMCTFSCLGGSAPHGRPSPLVQLAILGPDDELLPPGEVGEIGVRGVTVMNGYHNRPELNAQRQRNGWHHTNDLGRREADGSVTFVGPRVRMIKSAAENIYPAEVEGCIAQHPAVAACAVLGVPDDTWTQSVKAVVVLHDGMDATEIDIIEHCRVRIASYKKPRAVVFVAALPRVPIGFVDRDALDEQHGGGGYPGGWNRSA